VYRDGGCLDFRPIDVCVVRFQHPTSGRGSGLSSLLACVGGDCQLLPRNAQEKLLVVHKIKLTPRQAPSASFLHLNLIL
jgi:hypothetical protein